MKNKLLIFAIATLLQACSVNTNSVQPDSSAAQARASSDLPAALQNFSVADTAMRDLPGWQRPTRILVTFAEMGITKGLEPLLAGVEVVSVKGPVPKTALQGRFDAILSYCGAPASLQAIKGTRWVHSYSAGVEGCVEHPKLKANPDLILTNSRGAGSATIAEHAVAMMLAMNRQLPRYFDAMQNKRWAPGALQQQGPATVQGKTLLVLGLGNIGKETAKRAHALGMRVIATRNSRREGPDYVEYVGLANESIELAAQADVVVNAMPLTAATRGVVNAEFFNAMPADALFINVGRGATVNTSALIDALEGGSIAAAALDVVDPEPLPPASPLWTMPNVLITPHVAARSNQSMQLTRQIAQENLKRFLAGDALLNPVNLRRAY